MSSDALRKLGDELRRTRRGLPPAQERKMLRERAGLTQEQMARVLGCTRAAVSRFENGRDPRDPEITERYRVVLRRLSLETADDDD